MFKPVLATMFVTFQNISEVTCVMLDSKAIASLAIY
ncbi:hypothetical protein J2X15_002057 [Rhodoferax saidenbachensis]|uniref:Uncharacterized protein n=1 Tax=Rhodoferax saidenbachensis TaxID=1484693 RepID=A0ABU1ZMK1_9BURK|nr:hypothetical protein [Rhodoferax saidenbachensis]